jgi:hypothetical protein
MLATQGAAIKLLLPEKLLNSKQEGHRTQYQIQQPNEKKKGKKENQTCEGG